MTAALGVRIVVIEGLSDPSKLACLGPSRCTGSPRCL